ncbi:DUF2029 domain-containing protein [bacterium]|nr:DUF2029 domain-containing protein [bacterium]
MNKQVFVAIFICFSLIALGSEQNDFRYMHCVTTKFLQGENPYVRATAQSCVAKPTDQPIDFLYPPTVFSLFVPLATLSQELALIIWGLLSSAALTLSLLLILKRTQTRWTEHQILVSAFCFFPAFYCLALGQLACVLSLAFCLGALYFESSSKAKQLISGIAFALFVVKPNLAMLLLPLVLILALKSRRAHWLSGFTLGAAFLLGVPYGWNSAIYTQLLSADLGSSLNWQTPTLVSIGAAIFGTSKQLVCGVSFLAGLALISFEYWRYTKAKISAEWLLQIGLVSGLLISPYAWTYDYVILFFPFLLVINAIFVGEKKSYWLLLLLTLSCLRIAWSIEPQLIDAAIPALLLVPLLSNGAFQAIHNRHT